MHVGEPPGSCRALHFFGGSVETGSNFMKELVWLSDCLYFRDGAHDERQLACSQQTQFTAAIVRQPQGEFDVHAEGR